MSERVENELKKWKEEYDIPLTDEFNVKTLLDMQEEYDSIEKGSNTTRTREVLLHMIQDLKSHLRVQKKEKIKMYVNLNRTEATIYYDDNYVFFNEKEFSLFKVVDFIKLIAKQQYYNIEVKLDRGIGGDNTIMFCDSLDENKISYSYLMRTSVGRF